jgi:EAL domain-containing protein (putative c-di-GMP-specific phosphodiesterase class I)
MASCKKAFLIDDDPVFSAVASVLLKSIGVAEVFQVSNNEAEIRQVAKIASSSDLVLLGLNMSGIDGLAVLRILASEKLKAFVSISSSETGAIRDAAARLAALLGLKVAGELARPLRETEVRGVLEAIASASEMSFEPKNFGKGAPGKLSPVYQPKFDSSTGEIVGGEALMRIKTSDGTLLPPFEHLERVTGEGRLAAETLAFLDLILADMKMFRAAGHFPVVSVNVPAPVAEEAGFPSTFAAKVRACGISPSQITVELTESALPKELAVLVEVLTRLRMAGFGLALDDFGTGMANFDLLRTLPFHELKIDRSLAQAAEHDALSAGIIETCATITRELNMILVAEGVENEAQEKVLKRLGVSIFQGFLFGKGIPAAEFLEKLQSNTYESGQHAVNA